MEELAFSDGSFDAFAHAEAARTQFVTDTQRHLETLTALYNYHNGDETADVTHTFSAVAQFLAIRDATIGLDEERAVEVSILTVLAAAGVDRSLVDLVLEYCPMAPLDDKDFLEIPEMMTLHAAIGEQRHVIEDEIAELLIDQLPDPDDELETSEQDDLFLWSLVDRCYRLRYGTPEDKKDLRRANARHSLNKLLDINVFHPYWRQVTAIMLERY